MKIPDFLRINGVEFQVVENENLNNGINVLLGDICLNNAIITLNPERQGHQKKCITMLHEVNHAILANTGIKLEPDEEEAIIEAFAIGWYQLLEDNIERLYANVVQEKKSGETKA
jgi:hypothetical protein